MSSLSSKRGITKKSLQTMKGFIASVPASLNPAGYLSEIIDTLKFESDEQPVEVKEFINGKWRFVEVV